MSHPTDKTATQQALDDLISEAYAATGILPTIDRCHALNDALRAAIGELVDQVSRRRDELPVRSRGWYRCDLLVDDTRILLGNSMGVGLLSAALHVSELARQCQMLRDCIREAP